MTPEELFKYADTYARRKEDAGLGTQYPTFRQVCQRFRCKLDDVEDACGAYQGTGYMQPGIGIACGSGYYKEEYRSNWVVEAYKTP